MHMRKYYIIVNTIASVGYGYEKWEKIRSVFDAKEISYDYDITESKNHATILAIKAIKNGCKNSLCI
jgi:diacylglycerol kinase family enzyme